MRFNYIILLVMVFTLLSITSVSADLGTFKISSCVDIKTVLNTTAVNITSLTYPNTTVALSNVAMSSLSPNTFNYTFCSNDAFGKYIYSYCDVGNSCYVNSYSINGQGQEYSTTQGLIYIVLFFSLIVIFTVLLYSAFAIDGNNIRNEDQAIIMINYMKYTKLFLFMMAYVTFVGLTFFAWNISSGILNFDSLANFFFVFHKLSFVAMYTVIPILFIWFIIRYVIKDNKILEQLKRGYAVKDA